MTTSKTKRKCCASPCYSEGSQGWRRLTWFLLLRSVLPASEASVQITSGPVWILETASGNLFLKPRRPRRAYYYLQNHHLILVSLLFSPSFYRPFCFSDNTTLISHARSTLPNGRVILSLPLVITRLLFRVLLRAAGSPSVLCFMNGRSIHCNSHVSLDTVAPQSI